MAFSDMRELRRGSEAQRRNARETNKGRPGEETRGVAGRAADAAVETGMVTARKLGDLQSEAERLMKPINMKLYSSFNGNALYDEITTSV